MTNRTEFLVIAIITLAISISFAFLPNVFLVFAQPTITDPSLKTELVVDGLSSPSSIAFLDNNNILLLEKEGNLRLVSNGQLQQDPVLQLSGVESNNERGLLGIAIMKNSNSSTEIGGGNIVYLYVTENEAQITGVQTDESEA